MPDPLPALHPLLASRWSPTTFDGDAEASAAEISSVLEAARWAPSAGNAQPWAFLVGRRGDAVHTTMVEHLARSSGRWAPLASFLVVNLAHRYVEDTDWEYSEFSVYDLGQAVAHMTLQGQAMGLAARQFRAFDRDALAAEFAIAPHWQIMTMTAFGIVPHGGRGDEATPSPEHVPRHRRQIEELLWPGT